MVAAEAGDLVAAAGVDSALTGSVDPVLRVQRSGAAAPGAVGVVFSRASVMPSEKEGEALDGVQAADGAAQPGDYLLIVVQGLVQVKVAQGEALTPGQAPEGQRRGRPGPRPAHGRGGRRHAGRGRPDGWCGVGCRRRSNGVGDGCSSVERP